MEFTDVPKTAYYKDAVEWAVEKKITTGTGDGTTFSPNKACTRAEVVTFLWRAAGSPKIEGETGFSDVANSDWFADAVKWAVSKGITGGTGNGKFSPQKICDRAQIVTFLYRYENQPKVSGDSFSDVPAGIYYEEAVKWAVSAKITNGTGDGKFSPGKDCSRGEVVTFLFRDLAE